MKLSFLLLRFQEKTNFLSRNQRKILRITSSGFNSIVGQSRIIDTETENKVIFFKQGEHEGKDIIPGKMSVHA